MLADTDVRWSLAALMIVVSGYHGFRVLVALRRRTRAGLAVDLTHAAMGIGMTVMLIGSMGPLAGHLWAFGLGVPAVWFAVRAVRQFAARRSGTAGHDAGQAVLCSAMVYMFVAAGSMPDMSSQDWSAFIGRVIATALLLGSLAVTVSHARSMKPCAAASPRNAATKVASAGCQLTMGLTTVYMLAAAV